jgi:hypothetical protein
MARPARSRPEHGCIATWSHLDRSPAAWVPVPSPAEVTRPPVTADLMAAARSAVGCESFRARPGVWRRRRPRPPRCGGVLSHAGVRRQARGHRSYGRRAPVMEVEQDRADDPGRRDRWVHHAAGRRRAVRTGTPVSAKFLHTSSSSPTRRGDLCLGAAGSAGVAAETGRRPRLPDVHPALGLPHDRRPDDELGANREYPGREHPAVPRPSQARVTVRGKLEVRRAPADGFDRIRLRFTGDPAMLLSRMSIMT